LNEANIEAMEGMVTGLNDNLDFIERETGPVKVKG
jgi:hypothetical protein